MKYLSDIAVIETNNVFVLSEYVQPVCLDVSNSFIHPGCRKQIPSVSGWGYTQDGGLSNVSKSLEIPLVPYDACRQQIPEKYEEYLTYDKICGGYSNASNAGQS